MKTKHFSKKLDLNKKTVADLSKTQMKKFVGGITGVTCNFCDSNISCYIEKCMDYYTFYPDEDICKLMPTQTRGETCPAILC